MNVVLIKDNPTLVELARNGITTMYQISNKPGQGVITIAQLKQFSLDASLSDGKPPYISLWRVNPTVAEAAWVGPVVNSTSCLPQLELICFPKQEEDISGLAFLKYMPSLNSMIAAQTHMLCSKEPLRDSQLPYSRPQFLQDVPIRSLYFFVIPPNNDGLDFSLLAKLVDESNGLMYANKVPGFVRGAIGPFIPDAFVDKWILVRDTRGIVESAYILKDIIVDSRYLSEFGGEKVLLGVGGMDTSCKKKVMAYLNLKELYSMLLNSPFKSHVSSIHIPYRSMN